MKNSVFALIILGVGFLTFSLTTTNKNYTTDPDNCLDDLVIPQMFTPDGDSIDEVFTVNFPCKPESFEVQIFDLEGTELFMSLNSVFAWDGNDKDSTACVSGIYDWKIKYMYHMTYSERKGQLLLLR